MNWWKSRSKNYQASLILFGLALFLILIFVTKGVALLVALVALVWVVIRYIMLEGY